MKNVYEAQAANRWKSVVVISAFIVFVFLSAYVLTNALGAYIGYQPSGLGFTGMALIISGISSFLGYYYSDKVILTISGAKPASRTNDFLFYTTAENIAIGLGLPKPKLYVIEDSAPNAFATGRDPDHAAICATSGLLSKLDRTELEGVIAHEMSHIRNYDTRLMSLVSVMVGLIALLGDWLIRMTWFGRGNRDRDNAGNIFLILGIIFAILSPIIGTLIQLAISRRREFMADAGSVEITRQPSGLVSALKKIASDHEPLEVANKATAHLYIMNPFKEKAKGSVGWFSSLFNTHPPLTERIKALQNMT